MQRLDRARTILLIAAIGALFGVPLGCARLRPAIACAVIAALCAAAFFLVRAKKISDRHVVIAACCLGLIAGYVRGSAVMHAASDYRSFYDRHSELLADIVSEPQQKNGFMQVTLRGAGMSQGIVVRMASSANPQFGQEVVLSGTLHAPQQIVETATPGEPLGSFDYPGYLRSKGITATESMPHAFLVGTTPHTPFFFVQSIAYAWQSKLSDGILARYAITQQPLVRALLFGDRSDFNPDDSEQFVRTGTIHLVAVSGFKLTILLLLAQYMLQPFIPRRYLIAVTLLISASYVVMFGFDPPVVRAALMSAICMLGEVVGGGYEAAPLLVLVAASFALINPAAESFDSSFLFSVLGVLGIILIGPPIRNLLQRLVEKTPLRVSGSTVLIKFLVPAIAAYLLTMPLSFYWYGEVSLLMPFTALCIMPLFEPCIILGYLSALPSLGVVMAAANQPLLQYVAWAIGHLAKLAYVTLPIHINGYLTYFTYAVAGVLYFHATLKKPQGSATIPALPNQKPL